MFDGLNNMKYKIVITLVFNENPFFNYTNYI